MITNLRQGDIIVFKAEDEWLSKAIAWITKSDVCHAAMVYSDDSIVEVGANGIGVHNVETWAGDSVYVMRLSSEADPAPLIAAANNYLDAKIRYDFAGLFLLAGLLIYYRIRPTARLIPLVNRVLMEACLKLDEYIQHALLHHEGQAMVCSQLVYQIYLDCEEKYHISISGGLFSPNKVLCDGPDTICLADMIADRTAPSLGENLSHDAAPINDDVLKDLYFALVASENEDLCLHNVLDHSLSMTSDFLSKLKHFLEITKSDLTLDAMFVAPCDFVYHATNLTQVTTLSLGRVHKTT